MVTYKSRHFHPELVSSQSYMKPHGRNYYKLVTTYKPSAKDIRQAQISLGYDPAGYDGPFNVTVKQAGPDFVTLWESSSSCD